MASTKKKKPLTKDDLRRMMKEQRSANKASTKRIESPLAKYTSSGQLTCVLCNAPVKSDLLWNAHLQGRTHRDNVAKLKAEQSAKEMAKEAVFAVPKAVPVETAKRKYPNDGAGDNAKKVRANAMSRGTAIDGVPAGFFDSAARNQLPPGGGTAGSAAPTPSGGGKASESLPTDFFDKEYTPSAVKGEEEEEEEETAASSDPKPMAEQIPEGFFDDPRRDAKARKIEFKDKMDEEWELFQRAMKEEATVSEAILEEDEDQSTAERNIVEIDDQLQRWSKVDQLQKAKEAMMTHSEPTKTHREEAVKIDDDADDDADFEEFLDWRTKKAWK